MPKNSVADWDETASDNKDIAGINIDENCPPSGINNAIRTVMAQLKTFFKSSAFRIWDGTDSTKRLAFDLSGIATATTRTLAVPDKSGTMAMLDDAAVAAEFYDALINGNFDIWQRGISFTGFSTNAYCADRWRARFDGSGATRTISRQTHSLGQTDVPGDPTYFLRFAQTVAGTGATFNRLSQPIEGVRTNAGKKITITLYGRFASAGALPRLSVAQNFGTGGSPSGEVITDVAMAIPLGTVFEKVQYVVDVPSISGKTLGSNGDDYLELRIDLPVNTTFTFDLAVASMVKGDARWATEPPLRQIQQQLDLCQRFYEASSTPAPACIYRSGNVVASATYKVRKRRTPEVGIVGVSNTFTVNTNDTDGFSATAPNLDVYSFLSSWTANAEY